MRATLTLLNDIRRKLTCDMQPVQKNNLTYAKKYRTQEIADIYKNKSKASEQNTSAKCPKGIVPIVGDSIISGIKDDFLTANKRRFLRGGTLKDITDTIKPVLNRELE